MPYLSPTDDTRWIKGMKIIPIDTTDLRAIIKGSIAYTRLYSHFDKAYQDSDNYPHPGKWYEECVKIHKDV